MRPVVLAIAASFTFAVACGGSKSNLTDAGIQDATVGTLDLAHLNCTKIASWPGLNPRGGFSPTLGQDDNGYIAGTFAESENSGEASFYRLRVEEYDDGSVDFPFDEPYSQSSTYENCSICSILSYCANGTCGQKKYFPLGGTMQVTEASKNADQGKMTVNGTNLLFMEWNFGTDRPVPSAHCIEVDTASWSSIWPKQ